MPSSTRVAFIGATGRSGSTLAGRTLGSVPGMCHVGELCWIWNYGLLNNRPCGCGVPLRECEFWISVGDAAFCGWDRIDVDEMNRMRRDLVRTAMVPRLWPADASGPRAGQIDRYRRVLSRLYAGIAEVSGAEVIVDSSKQAAAALLARRSPDVDLRVIHLVRSPHGVAYSWTKHVSRADMGGRPMRRRTPWRTALRWDADVALFERLGRTAPLLRVRYEDFVARADETTMAMAGFAAGRAPDRLDFVGPSWVDLAPDHSVWGNPMRDRRGPASLKLDDAWRGGLPATTRRVVSALTWTQARRYGYPE